MRMTLRILLCAMPEIRGRYVFEFIVLPQNYLSNIIESRKAGEGFSKHGPQKYAVMETILC